MPKCLKQRAYDRVRGFCKLSYISEFTKAKLQKFAKPETSEQLTFLVWIKVDPVTSTKHKNQTQRGITVRLGQELAHAISFSSPGTEIAD